MGVLATLEAQAVRLRQHTLTIYCAARDPRTPVAVRALAVIVAAYALSPIDLIPDFIPVIGYLDDLLLLPLGLALILRLTPPEVLESARRQAENMNGRPVSRSAAVIVVLLWLAVLFVLARWLLHWLGETN